MLSQIEINKELQFIAFLLPIMMGFQLTIYLFFQYQKTRDKNLPLNRILLAFGSFIFFLILGTLLIHIARNFIENEIIHVIITRIGWFFGFFSTICFSSIIIAKEFSSVINIKIAKILLIFTIIPVVVLFIVPNLLSPLFISSIIFIVLNGLYLVRFQMIMIRKVVGNIKKKFELFLYGTLISLVALTFAIFVGLGVLPPILNEIIYYTGICVLIIGFIIISFSVINFPPFYEFEWRKNLIKLFIINQQNKSCIYSYDFIEKFKDKNAQNQNHLKQFENLFSKGILGIESIIGIITNTKGKGLNEIEKGDYHIFLEDSQYPFYLTFVLIVKVHLISTPHLLKSIKGRFELFFREILLNLNNFSEEYSQLFSSFDNIMNQILQM
ncbi:MAG: hypothetical protein ACFFCE_03480 [Promethearchaeota archaeon]